MDPRTSSALWTGPAKRRVPVAANRPRGRGPFLADLFRLWAGRRLALSRDSTERTRAVLDGLIISGAGKCAQGDSNSHGPNGPQGPQPCASTSSATGA